jgi:DNA-binding LacI/PurR family transcriptional regulator
MIENFESLAGQYGIDVTIINTGYSEERFRNGVKPLLERGLDAGTGIVFLNQRSVIGNFQNVTVDYVKGFHDAVEHLRMLGHRRIGFVASPRPSVMQHAGVNRS